ncbi:MAG: phage minor capsid protein [Faecalibacterium prausnitzii]|nr:phage minor capsid protein [Faecalibacterium prausnitzii]
MDEMGCRFVETTAHGGARPSHAAWQRRSLRAKRRDCSQVSGKSRFERHPASGSPQGFFLQQVRQFQS